MTTFGQILSTASVKPKTAITVTPGASPTVTVVSGTDGFATWTAGENETLAISGAHAAGDLLMLLIVNDGTPRTITFGTGFVSSAVVIGAASKRSVIVFASDATNFYEVSRTVGI